MKYISLAAAGCAGIALVLLALIGTADVIGAQAGVPVPGTLEIGASLMVAGIALGLPKAQYDRRQIRVEIFVDRLPPRLRAVFDVIAQLSLAVMLGAIGWMAWPMFFKSIATNEFAQGLIELPMWPARLALALGATLAVVQTIVLIVRRPKQGPADPTISQI